MLGQPPVLDYYEMFGSLIMRASELSNRRDELETEIAKLRQLIVATFPLIPEEKQKLFQSEVDAMDEESGLGLIEAIKLVFSAHRGEWLTASHVRNYLEGIGFDFRRYRANPLASISTTLKRMVPTSLEVTDSGSGTLYRRRKTIGDRMAEGFEKHLAQGQRALDQAANAREGPVFGVPDHQRNSLAETIGRLGAPNPTGTRRK